MNYHLNFEYDNKTMRLFVNNDLETIHINEFIDYSKWSENRLRYLNKVLDEKINNLISECQLVVPDLKIEIEDKVNTKFKAIENITRMVKENNNTIENQIKKLDINIKSWYKKNYPHDEVGDTLSSTVTFLELNNLLNSGYGDVYTLLGGDADTVIRERCFEKLSELIDCNYDSIYYKWLNLKPIKESVDLEEEIEK